MNTLKTQTTVTHEGLSEFNGFGPQPAFIVVERDLLNRCMSVQVSASLLGKPFELVLQFNLDI